MQHGLLSARGELQSHPLAGQAQACGRPTQVDGPGGPDGTCRGHCLIPLLKKEIDYISRFVHVILAPVHAILLCIIQARNSSNYVRHPYAGAFLSSARADVEIFLRRHCRRRSKKTGKSSGHCTVEIPVQSTEREFRTSLPCRRTSPLFNNFLKSCNSLLETANTPKKNEVSSQEPCCSKKNHKMCSFCTCPSVDPSLGHVIASHFAPGPC